MILALNETGGFFVKRSNRKIAKYMFEESEGNRVIGNELKFLAKNKLLVFVMVVILLIPSIYAGVFLSSMWDPYGDIGKLPVAVVNRDVAVEYDGKTLCVGDSLEKSLESSEAMDFHITDAVTAENGLKNGDYYMVITIPEDFSKNASTMLDANPQKMRLQYATNPGYNYISGKLSESAIKEIKAQIMAEVTTTYTKAVFASISEIGNGFSQAADGTGKLLLGMNTLSDGAAAIVDNLGVLASSSITLQEGGTALADGVGEYIDGVKKVDSGLDTFSGGVNTLADGAQQLLSGSRTLLAGVNAMKNQLDNSLTDDKISQINTASSSLLTMNDNIQRLNAAVNGDGTEENKGIDISGIGTAAQSAGANLQTAGGSLNAAASSLVGAYAATGQEADLGGSAQKVIATYLTLAGLYQDSSLTEAQKTTILRAMTVLYDANNQVEENTAFDDIVGAVTSIKSAGGNIQGAGNALSGLAQSDMSGQVAALQTSVQQLAIASDRLLPASSNAMASMLSGMMGVKKGLGQTIRTDGQTGIVEGVSQLNSGIEKLYTGITGENSLQSGVRELKAGSTQLVEKGGALEEGAGRLNDGISQLSDGANALAEGSAGLQDGITALMDGTATLDTALKDGAAKVTGNLAADSNIDMFVTPLVTEETQVTTVKNNGHAMAAYMMSVGLWVGCLAFCLMYPLAEYHGKLKNGFTWFASKAVIVYPTAVIMGIVLYFILHIANGFQPVQMGNTILVSVASAICFMSIMYFFNAMLGKVGSFFMLVFMVLQLAGSAGTYPIEISGSFAAAIHRYVPFTYTVNAFRSAISGGAGIGGELGVLIVLTVIFVLLTIALFIYRANRIKAGKPIFYIWIEERGLA